MHEELYNLFNQQQPVWFTSTLDGHLDLANVETCRCSGLGA